MFAWIANKRRVYIVLISSVVLIQRYSILQNFRKHVPWVDMNDIQ
jgi:hypothetical protein